MKNNARRSYASTYVVEDFISDNRVIKKINTLVEKISQMLFYKSSRVNIIIAKSTAGSVSIKEPKYREDNYSIDPSYVILILAIDETLRLVDFRWKRRVRTAPTDTAEYVSESKRQ